MAKKATKQPKRTTATASSVPTTNTVSLSNNGGKTTSITVATTLPMSAEPTASITCAKFVANADVDPPASSVDTSSPVSATSVAFRDFIQLADHESINLFFDIAATSPQCKNLKPLWERAFKEGLRVGHQLY